MDLQSASALFSGEINTSAPGKVILCGEYAVLEGFPCLTMAVNRRLHVSLSPMESASTGIEVHPLGQSKTREKLLLNSQGDGFECVPGSALALLTSLLNSSLQSRAEARQLLQRAWHLGIDSSALFYGKHKLGLGSSAAMTVALYAAIEGAVNAKYSPQKSAFNDLWSTLQWMHSTAQGKEGSGVDIASCLHGGVTRFIRRADGSCEISGYEIPEGVAIAFIWSGASASTPEFLVKLDRWRKRQPELYKELIFILGEVAEKMAGATKGGQVLSSLRDFTEVLYEFATQSGLAIFAGGHTKLREIARNMPDLVYKPCGAGGGDLGIAISEDPELLVNYKARAKSLGYPSIDLAVDRQGLQLQCN